VVVFSLILAIIRSKLKSIVFGFIPFLLPFVKPTLPYITGFLFLLTVFVIGYIKGGSVCEVKHAQAAAIVAQQTNTIHDEIEKKVMSLKDKALNKRLNKWLRD